jgi:hypothetical protein
LKIGCTKPALHIGSVVVLWERIRDYNRSLAIHFRGSYASLVWWKKVELKCSETDLALSVDEVFGNDWWYAFNTNACFIGYVNVAIATITFVHKSRGKIGSQ